MSILGERFCVPISHGCGVEGVVINETDDGLVTIVDENGEKWCGRDYQLESVIEAN